MQYKWLLPQPMTLLNTLWVVSELSWEDMKGLEGVQSDVSDYNPYLRAIMGIYEVFPGIILSET